jgi:hypothetical protein
MWLVLTSAVCLAGYREVQQSRQRARDYELRRALGEFAKRYGKSWIGCRGSIGSVEPPRPNPKRAAHHASMRGEWARAAAFPYLPVVLDPTEPGGSIGPTSPTTDCSDPSNGLETAASRCSWKITTTSMSRRIVNYIA